MPCGLTERGERKRWWLLEKQFQVSQWRTMSESKTIPDDVLLAACSLSRAAVSAGDRVG
jgi:hypothetical protein